jgi:putative flippase GtrA
MIRSMPEQRSSRQQVARFALIGVLSNSFFYALYLILTYKGMRPTSAMSLTYALAVANTFFLNRTWTFTQRGKIFGPLGRYIVAYAVGYLFNLSLLEILINNIGLAHQVSQGISIVSIAVLLFLLQKYWVFRADA